MRRPRVSPATGFPARRLASSGGRHPAQATDTDPDGVPISGALRALAVVGPPVTVATALLFYFGWALSAEQSRAMGVDESIFAMSTRDYVLRSLSALFVPLIVGSAVLLLWVVLHGLLLGQLDDETRRRGVRRAGNVLAWTAWWAVPCIGLVLGLLGPRWRELVIPLSLAVGFLLTEYGVRVRAVADDADGQEHDARPPWVGNLRGVLVGVLVTAALFWEVANFAEVVGRGKAELVLASSNSYPLVAIYSQRDLQIDVPGVTTEVLPGEDAGFRFRYTGLHLLQRTGGRYFLVPEDWSPSSAPLVVLRDEESIRLEFTGSSSR
ncbi:hypothetical protein [Nocardioides sp.]|uniref:hypothetical protein n=1 Tax=Nocardioides sp. TaxID=35761 RepID=UPI0035AE2BC6